MLNKACWHLLLPEDQEVQVGLAIKILALCIRELLDRGLIINFENTIIELILELDFEAKGGSLVPLALEGNLAVEPLHDLLGDDQAQADSTSVYVLRALDKAKQLEKLALVFPFDAHASVLDLHLAVRFPVELVKGVIDGDRAALLGELEGVRLDVEKDLLKSSLVSGDHDGVSERAAAREELLAARGLGLAVGQIRVILAVDIFGRGVEERHDDFRLREILLMVARCELDAAHLGLVFLDVNYFLNCFFEVERSYNFSKFTGVYLGEVQEVVHQEAHHVCRGVLNIVALLDHRDYLTHRFIYLLDCFVLAAI